MNLNLKGVLRGLHFQKPFNQAKLVNLKVGIGVGGYKKEFSYLWKTCSNRAVRENKGNYLSLEVLRMVFLF